jgi:phosphoribosylformylglycinamidine synthase
MRGTGETMVNVEVRINLKKGVADPEGKNTLKALKLLGIEGISDVKSVKVFTVSVDTEDPDKALEKARKACEMMLANPVIHNYTVEVKG